MSVKPVAIILGVGARTGKPIVDYLIKNGYSVAAVSRSITEGQDGNLLNIKGDLSKPDTLPAIFKRVTETYGAPTLVIHNAYLKSDPSSKDDWFSHDTATLSNEYTANTLSVFAAAREAVAGWKTLKLSKSQPGVFIYTGNILNVRPFTSSGMLSLGMGKSASSYLISALTLQFKDEPYRFYFADERTAEGEPVYDRIDGPAHAEFYLQLAKGETSVPWHATFAKGIGYKEFEGQK